MMSLSTVGSEGHPALGAIVHEARAAGLARIRSRLRRAVAAKELPEALDTGSLARFIQTVQAGMSILARDGARRVDLEGVAQSAMLAWDARVNGTSPAPVSGPPVAPDARPNSRPGDLAGRGQARGLARKRKPPPPAPPPAAS